MADRGGRPAGADGAGPDVVVTTVAVRLESCDRCDGPTFTTARTVTDSAGRWAVARCPACAEDIVYRDREPRSIRVPGRVHQVATDGETEIAAAVWRDGDTWGIRILDLFRQVVTDVVASDHGPVTAVAAGAGVVVVFDGCPARYDPALARRHPVRALSVVDAASGSVRWQRPVPAEPVVEIVGEFVRLSWPAPRSSAEGPQRSPVVARLADGSVVVGEQTIGEVETQRTAAWWAADARPKPATVVEGSPAFEEWAQRVREVTGSVAVMKLAALRHEAVEVIDHFTAGDGHGRQEHLVIARDGRPLWIRRIGDDEAPTVEFVGGAWDPQGFGLEGRWVVATTAPDLVELFPVR